MQLIPADSGSVRLFGNDLGSQSPKSLRTLRARVGFIFQKHNLVPRLSVLSNVLHGALALKSTPRLWYHGFASSADRNEAMHCLSRVGLADLAARRVETLSGGQSQRVAIARALMQRPTVLFADEPVASLDPQAGQEVMELFVRLVREEGLSLVFVSHHLEHALHYSDRILGLKDSYLQLDTTPSRESLDSLRAIYGKVDLSTGVQV